jgi:hypothetical protein
MQSQRNVCARSKAGHGKVCWPSIDYRAITGASTSKCVARDLLVLWVNIGWQPGIALVSLPGGEWPGLYRDAALQTLLYMLSSHKMAVLLVQMRMLPLANKGLSGNVLGGGGGEVVSCSRSLSRIVGLLIKCTSPAWILFIKGGLFDVRAPQLRRSLSFLIFNPLCRISFT